MLSFRFLAASCVLACLAPLSARAADDLAALKAELEALKADYSQRVGALESRITQLEAAAVADAGAPPPPEASVPPPMPSAGGRGGAAAFNPAISVILAGN